MLRSKVSFAIFLSATGLGFCGCAKETTAEERKREENDRAYKRLEPAIGTYNGYAFTERQQRIPVQVNVVQQRSPTGVQDNPTLSVSLRVGMLGGVALSSPNASYDWGAKRLVATFKPSAGASQKFVELRGKLEGDKLLDAVVVGSRIGSLKLDVNKNAPSTLSEFSETQLALRADENGNNPMLLTLKRAQNDTVGPETSDLAFLPGLEASLRFPGMGKVPEQASAVTYDPFTGVLEVDFRGRTKLRFANLFDKRSYGGEILSPLNLNGEISFGSQRLEGVNASSQPQDLQAASSVGTELPPRVYTGTYEVKTNGGMRLRSLALLDYLGSDGQNMGDTPFRAFPNLRLRLFLCLGGQTFLSRQLDLKSLDHLGQRARFNEVNASGAANAALSAASFLDVQFKNGWSDWSGQFLSAAAGDGAVGSENAQLILQNDSRSLQSCADLEPLTAAETGSLQYAGVLLKNSTTAVPAGLVIFPKRNPSSGSEEPTLQATLRLGFFGGVTIASEPAFFDWGNGRISAAFKRPSGPPLELKTALQEEVLTRATLVGPNLGTSLLRLSRNGKNYFDNIKENTFRAHISTERPASSAEPGVGPSAAGYLAINRRTEDFPAPANIDLPILPSLEASLRLNGIAQTPQVAQKMTYDPLRGALDIQLSGASTVEFREIYLTAKKDAPAEWETAPIFTGRILLGAAQQGYLTLERANLTSGDFGKLQQLPPRGFVGILAGGFTTKAVAYIDYLGTTGTNSAEYPFAAFPNLRLTIITCLHSKDAQGNAVFKEFRKSVFALTSYDVVRSKALFKGPASEKLGDLDVDVGKDWGKIEGIFRNTEGSGGGTGSSMGARINLQARPNFGSLGCGEL